ncbi:MAG: DUF975 family protein [Nitrospira sp.]
MKTANKVLIKQARESLKGQWGTVIGVGVFYFLLIMAIQNIPKSGGILSMIISGPMGLGLAMFYLSVSRNKNANFEQIFEGFKRFQTSLITYLLMVLYILLWSLLLIVPGIIASISYSMTFFILADDASIGPREALDKSKKMMMGYKWKLFCLGFRFFGWAILAVLTFGIGFIWLIPYMQVADAKFYDDIKDRGESTPAVV